MSLDSLESIYLEQKVCAKCFKKMNPVAGKFQIDGVNGEYIYDYNEMLKEMIYRFKGCGDYELRDAFLWNYRNYLREKYKDRILIPAPSYSTQEEIRGFSHVEEMFSCLLLPLENLFIKTSALKQANLDKNEREMIKKNILMKENKLDKAQKILLIDDIVTTGSTLQAMIVMMRKRNFFDLKILVVCKTIYSSNEYYSTVV